MRITPIVAGLLLLCGIAGASEPRAIASGHPPIPNKPREIRTIAPVQISHSIRVVTWNIDRGTRIDGVVADMEANPTDLCLFQEVDWGTKRTHGANIAAELAKRLHLNAVYGVTFEELGEENDHHPAYIGQATLTKLPIEKSRILRFRHQSGWWKPREWIPSEVAFLQRRRGGRIALVTELRFAGRLLVVYNIHLESRSFGKRQFQQLDEILADAGRYPPGTAIIVGGDFNSKYFPSKYLEKMEGAGFHSALGRRIERTHKIAMALDWIFARGPVVLEGGQVRKDFGNASDHFAVFVQLVAR